MSLPKGPFLEFEKPIAEMAEKIDALMQTGEINFADVKELVQKKENLQRKIAGKLSAWNRVELARRTGRPFTLDYIQNIFGDFLELHGDRCFGDDGAIITGLARLEGRSVVVMGHQKGRDTKENIKRNFGCAHPEGYRKALRMMKMAEKFKLPVISFIDTPGAYPGIGAEERGQAEAIAKNLQAMSGLEVPVIVVIIGEGASGGALGIGVGDRILMMENAWYCVISPEGCAAILYGDASKKQDVSSIMKLTAQDLTSLGLVDRIIDEPLGGAHWDINKTYNTMRSVLVEELETLSGIPVDKLLEERLEKISNYGVFQS